MVISLVYTPPFLAVERVTAMAKLSVTVLRLAIKLVVAQFCKARGHEIINEGAEFVWSENLMRFSYHQQLATSLPPHSQLLGRCIAGQ